MPPPFLFRDAFYCSVSLIEHHAIFAKHYTFRRGQAPFLTSRKPHRDCSPPDVRELLPHSPSVCCTAFEMIG